MSKWLAISSLGSVCGQNPYVHIKVDIYRRIIDKMFNELTTVDWPGSQ